jgi:hypothetical protein
MQFVALYVAAFFYAIWQAGGWPAVAMLCGVIVLLEILLLHVLPLVLRLALRSRGQFQYLPPLEQALRRGSQGFALMVLTVLAVLVPHVWLHGWRDLAGIVAPAFVRPADAWPLFLCVALFVVGAVRFMSGARLSAGSRDGMRRAVAALRFAAGIAFVACLVHVDLLGRLALVPAGIYLCAVAYAVGLWLLLVAGMRVVLLSWPRGWAFGMVDTHIRDTEFSWDDGEESARRWWQFWKGRNG